MPGQTPSLLRCVRAAEQRLRPALAAAQTRRPRRERWMRRLRRLEPLGLVPARLPAAARYYLPARPRPNSKAAAVVTELCAAGVPRAAIWTRDDDRGSRPLRALRALPLGLALLWRLARRAPHLDDVQQQVVLGHAFYRRFLRHNPDVIPVIVSDVSPELHMLWSAAGAEGNRALWWQDDFHHVGPLAQPIALAAVLNEGGVLAASRSSPQARLLRRPLAAVAAIRPIPAAPIVGVAVNAAFAANPAQRALLARIRDGLGASSLALRLHPNSGLHAAGSPEPWIEIAPHDEPLAAFAARIDLCVVGNSAVQLRLLCEGVPVLHVAGLDGNGHDLYGYCRRGLICGSDAIAVDALNRHYRDPAFAVLLAGHVGVPDAIALAGLDQLPGASGGMSVAKAVLICMRDRAAAEAQAGAITQSLRAIDARLRDERLPPALWLGHSPGVFTACLQHVDSVRVHGASIALGWVEGEGSGWAIPGEPVGDGSNAILRVSDDTIELVTDALATRTLWYHLDDERLIASTSQRVLVMLLGSFEANKAAVPWMLANGVTGPVGGWDKRLQRVAPGARLTLDRASWRARSRVDTLPPALAPLRPARQLDADNRAAFETAVRTSIDRLDVVFTRWVLPLSGGYDSRLLACLLASRERMRAVTWSMEPGAGENAETRVAADLAAALELPHDFIALGQSGGDLAETLDRFVAASEGLTDSVAAYLDGFQLWADFARDGVQGILRGDEPFGGFGWAPVHSEADVRMGLGLALLGDRPSTVWLAGLDGMAQRLPRALHRIADEPLESWRHRLYCAYRVPVALAALTETKTGYVEVLNPLQTRRIVDVVRALPDRLRTDKRLLIELVERLTPPIAYASIREGDVLTAFLRAPATIRLMRETLDSATARRLLPGQAIERLLADLPEGGAIAGNAPARLRPVDRLKALLPRALKRRLKRFVPGGSIDPCVLAFRAWIVVRSHALFAEDAAALARMRDDRHLGAAA